MEYTKAWLNYTRLPGAPRHFALDCPDLGTVTESIRAEFKTALTALYGATPVLAGKDAAPAGYNTITLALCAESAAGCEGYRLEAEDGNYRISSAGENGLLYGSFALIERLRTGKIADGDDLTVTPSNPLRMLNHWDNLNGTIERGYSGNSFFFKDEELIVNERSRDYARLVASVGINAVCINNVNVRGAGIELVTPRYIEPLKRLAEIFAAYGIRIFLSLSFIAPKRIGGLETADPLDEGVRAFWRGRADYLFGNIPNFGGFVVKADSEGEPGPFAYGRSHADGANMLAEMARPYGGLVIWRCFVYNNQQDWRDRITDRARAGYDNFIGHDGEFADNVILQIKNGPVDFQVREPVHPLFGGLKRTNMILEVQAAQEYTGQQRHVCYLIPMYREVLDFRTYAEPALDTVADIVSGKTYGNKNCGMVAVSNTGDDTNWTGHDLAAANLYGFGRLAFDTSLSPEQIALDWIALTFGADEKVQGTVLDILMRSWAVYEKYTAPLGVGWMVRPGWHYGPSVDGYEYDRWGTYHRADHMGVGNNRTSTGTGYTAQYNEPNASLYENIETCPDELLLFFHHVPYRHRLKSGKTVIQHIYDAHFEGARDAARMLDQWRELEGLVEGEAYARALERFTHQAESAREWCDQVNSYFHRMSWIDDEKGRPMY